jgi:hypothetical protein
MLSPLAELRGHVPLTAPLRAVSACRTTGLSLLSGALGSNGLAAMWLTEAGNAAPILWPEAASP